MRNLMFLCLLAIVIPGAWGQQPNSGLLVSTPMIGQPVSTPSLAQPPATPMAERGPNVPSVQPSATSSTAIEPQRFSQAGASNATAGLVAGASNAAPSPSPLVNLQSIYYGDSRPPILRLAAGIQRVKIENPDKLGAATFDEGYSTGEPEDGRSLAERAKANRKKVVRAPRVYNNSDIELLKH
jgi:hypothetical protein